MAYVDNRGAREFLFFLSDVRNIFSCPSWFRFYHVQYSVRRIEGAYRVFHALRGSGIRWRLFVFYPKCMPAFVSFFRTVGAVSTECEPPSRERLFHCFKQEIMMLIIEIGAGYLRFLRFPRYGKSNVFFSRIFTLCAYMCDRQLSEKFVTTCRV